MIHFLFLPFIPHVFSQQCGRVENSDTSFLASLFRSHPKDTQRIIGGVKALPGAWPWQALIKYKDYIDGEKEWANRDQIAGQEYLCGGALISRRHILTAAHCVMTMNLAPTRIFLGADTANPVDTQKTVSVRAVAKSTHPLYSANEEVNPSQENDIAIITPAIIYSKRISPVCVAGPGFNLTDFGYVTGYGAYSHGTQIIQRGSDFLQQSLLPIVDFESCSEKWQNELLEYGGGFTINDKTQICAGAVGHGSAQGDSGGPFVQIATDGKWYQVGVVSFGINTGKGYYDQALAPGIYTRVSNYCDWIAQTTRREVNCTVSSPSTRQFFLGILAFISTILL